MKLIIAIVSQSEAGKVSDELRKFGYSSTKVDSLGGFLKKRNAMLYIGVDDKKVRDVTRIIERNTHTHEQPVPEDIEGSAYNLPPTVTTSGAVLFILDVDQFFKV